MTEALFGLQVLCSTLSAVSFAMVRFSRRKAWLWPMGTAVLGLVICVGLATWSPVLGLGRPDYEARVVRSFQFFLIE